jgi:hypothetical protein
MNTGDLLSEPIGNAPLLLSTATGPNEPCPRFIVVATALQDHIFL